MKIQEKFKAIRKQRKLSLKTLSEVAGSATSISDFENGKTRLSNDVLLQLLAFMIVEINEFFEWEEFQDGDFVHLMRELEAATRTTDSASLIELQEEFQQLAIKKGQYIYQIISLVLDIIIAECNDLEINPQVISELTDYFFSLDYWTNLDVGLLGNTVRYFTTEALILFTNTILEHTPQLLRNNLDRIKIDTVLNCLAILIERQEKDASHDLLTLLSRKQYPPYFAFEKLYFNELQAIYDFNWRDKKQAMSVHHTILATISLLFSKNEAEEWDNYFQKHTISNK